MENTIKILVIGKPSDFHLKALEALAASEGVEGIVVVADSDGGSTDGHSFPQPLEPPMESITFLPKFFPRPKSKYHK